MKEKIPKEDELKDFLDDNFEKKYVKNIYGMLFLLLGRGKKDEIKYPDAVDFMDKIYDIEGRAAYGNMKKVFGKGEDDEPAQEVKRLVNNKKYEKIYEKITNELGLSKNEERLFKNLLKAGKDTEDKNVKVNFEEKLQKSENLHFRENQWEKIKSRVHNSLKNGKHLILIGPPGTGKSKLAKAICDYYRDSKDQWKMSTATSDWTTFDTIGGYRMKENKELEFKPGIFLDCFKKNGDMINKWLIIDEINRADIDKAFGALFSALTGDNLTLPYKIEGENVKVIGDPEENNDYNKPSHFIIHDDWRIIATMNTFDKASLYEMSYAFMRRFAFIRVGIPKKIDDKLIKEYIDRWDEVEEEKTLVKDVRKMWEEINKARAIGPALVKDIYTYLLANREDYEGALIQYVYPQFEGISKNKQKEFIENIGEKIEDIDKQILSDFVEDFFRINITNGEG